MGGYLCADLQAAIQLNEMYTHCSYLPSHLTPHTHTPHRHTQVLGAEGRVVPVEEGTPGAACYVGVGGPFVQDGTTCRIANPDTRECQGQGRVGEIWLDGPSKVGLGVWMDG